MIRSLVFLHGIKTIDLLFVGFIFKSTEAENEVE